jgi:hypothetical protein
MARMSTGMVVVVYRLGAIVVFYYIFRCCPFGKVQRLC